MTSPMRFAFVSTMAGEAWGASENLWFETAIRLAGEGHRVYASVTYWPEPRPPLEKLREAGIEISERPQSPVPLWMKVLKKAGLRIPVGWQQRRARRWLSYTRADLVCVSNGDVASGADWLDDCNTLGLRYVNVANGNNDRFWTNDGHADQVRRVFSSAQKCFFVSQGNRELFEKQIAHRLPNSAIVRCPFNVSWDAHCPWPDGAAAEWRLAVVGRLEPAVKGQDLVIEVLARPEWRERPVFVSIYGVGRSRETLVRLASLYGVSDRVRFCGHVENMEAVWATHHALVMPSRADGLPLVTAEAMLCARPVIATDVAGTRELLDDGVTGFIAEAPTVELLAAAMERAWIRRSDWPAMGAEASRRVRERVPQNPAGVFAATLVQIAAGV